jgi:hypothetical protein
VVQAVKRAMRRVLSVCTSTPVSRRRTLHQSPSTAGRQSSHDAGEGVPAVSAAGSLTGMSTSAPASACSSQLDLSRAGQEQQPAAAVNAGATQAGIQTAAGSRQALAAAPKVGCCRPQNKCSVVGLRAGRLADEQNTPSPSPPQAKPRLRPSGDGGC